MTSLPDCSLSGKSALVTGASSGLGAHFARLLATAGAQVWLAARRVEKLRQLQAELSDQGLNARSVAMDVSSAASVRAAFDEMSRDVLPDVVINNAGIGSATLALDTPETVWDEVINTNLKGAWLVATEAARRLHAYGRGGCIVNVSSILGERVGMAVAPYTVSKAGLSQMTRALALEWARHGIRVNALAPGYVMTDLNREFLESDAGQRLRKRIPQQRFGTASDLDGALLLLATDAGRFMTGAVVPVDGGHLVSGL